MAKVRIGKFKVESETLVRQHVEAVKRAKAQRAVEPRARAVSYDRKQNRLVIEMKNGVTFIVPSALLEGIASAKPEEIADVVLGPRGAALHWEKLDQDFSVAGLLEGLFGTRKWMNEGSGENPSKAKASRTRTPGASKPQAEGGRKRASSR